MKNYLLTTLLSFASLFAISCETTNNLQRDFLVQTGTDVGLALLVSETPEFAPYANAVAEIIRTRDLKPDTLDASFQAYKETEVSDEDLARVSIILDLISRNYRNYYEAKAVPMEPEVYADVVASQLTEDLKTSGTK